MLRAGVLTAAILLVAGCGGGGDDGAGGLVATPRTGLLDAPLRVRAPDAEGRLTLVMRTADAAGMTWTSRTAYAAGDATPLLESMLPLGELKADRDAYEPPAKQVIELVLMRRGEEVGSAEVVRRYASPDVKTQDHTVAADGFAGRFCAGRERRGPAVLFLGSSEGGLPDKKVCGLLASHGYPTLALAYFGARGLPRDLERIPLEYFAPPLEWLAKQRGVDPQKVVALGASRGGELALLLGSRYPRLVHGVVGYVPSAYAFAAPRGKQPAWTFGGKTVSYATTAAAPQESLIPVERIDGPVLVIAGGQDGQSPSRTFVESIRAQLRDHGKRDVTAITYPDAGHGVAGDALARAAAWQKLLEYRRSSKRTGQSSPGVRTNFQTM